MKASESNWVNSILNIIGVNSLRLRSLHIIKNISMVPIFNVLVFEPGKTETMLAPDLSPIYLPQVLCIYSLISNKWPAIFNLVSFLSDMKNLKTNIWQVFNTICKKSLSFYFLHVSKPDWIYLRWIKMFQSWKKQCEFNDGYFS